MTKEVKQEHEPIPKPISIGCTLFREPLDCSNRGEHLLAWQQLIDPLKGNKDTPFEIQYEPYYETGYWQDIVGLLNTNLPNLSVHSPIRCRDIASENASDYKFAVTETCRAMDLAHALNSQVFVLHLTPHDNWEKRQEQLERGLESLAELTDYKNKNGYGFQTLLETLEWPKSPSNLTETVSVLQRAKYIDPHIGFCVDVAHLWHNLVWLSPEADRNVNFPEKLREYLNTTEKVAPIRRFHIGGSYIDLSRNGGVHQTHGVPGQYNAHNPGQLYYDSPPPDFNGIWMPVNDVSAEIKKFINKKGGRSGLKDTDIILEIHEVDMETQINGVTSMLNSINNPKL